LRYGGATYRELDGPENFYGIPCFLRYNGIMDQKEKRCATCKQFLNILNFYKNKSTKDGLHKQCKNCIRKKYELNMQDPEFRKRKCKASKEWVNNNKERRKEYDKKRNKIKTIKISIQKPSFKPRTESQKISSYYRRRLREMLDGKRYSKTVLKYLGCSIEEFKIYMESMFMEGMNWSNRGYTGWHIDHKIPCCNFNMKKEEDLMVCFHYTNMQPLWAEDNMKKHTKIL